MLGVRDLRILRRALLTTFVILGQHPVPFVRLPLRHNAPMTRPFLLLPALALGHLLCGQTHFYIEEIAVLPAAPTTSDAVTVQLIGNLSDTGAGVMVQGAGVAGTQVAITLVATSNGGFTVLVSHTEAITLGPLPAGTYTIDLTDATTGVMDLAPAAQHTFTVSDGGFPCPEVQIDLQWHPFTDTALVVHVQHTTVEVFDYPNFILLDAQGDTIAIEPGGFIGIPQDSWHVLPLRDGVTLDGTAFQGRLELWTGFGSTLACAWEEVFTPCPPPPCAPLQPTLTNLGGALVLGTFDYRIDDAAGEVVATGTWTLTEGQQAASDSLCLPAGQYTMQVFPQQEPTGGYAVFSVQAAGWLGGPSAAVYQDVPNMMPFGFLVPCASGPQSIGDADRGGMLVTNVPGGILVVTVGHDALGNVSVFDAQGRMIGLHRGTGDRLFIPFDAPGVRILRTDDRTLKVIGGLD